MLSQKQINLYIAFFHTMKKDFYLLNEECFFPPYKKPSTVG